MIRLFGITIVQAWIYANSNTDKWPLRLLVAILVLLDLTTTCLNVQILHYYLVSNFGNLINTTLVTKTLMVETFITLVIVLCVELFFASRVWMMGTFHWIVPVLIVGKNSNELELHLFNRKNLLEIGWNCSLAAVSDIIASVSLLWAFSSLKNGIKQTPFHFSLSKVYAITMSKCLIELIFPPLINGVCYKLQLQCLTHEML
ncbi:hypothetical protein K435DRAFT_763309 [Dendrothele bispora CBS 962.96]|uniref:Uncharacterized protein n=1 Tax=Dendrothele bispora (strain CBS 962.96) TaxID=1314807 RepID=A0A4S8LC51_DENBC|nr:hypothetical protein K435DRAFT_763309 [Dendrothele bispora CBS 962.96]